MAEVINGILINEVETKNIMTKSSLPVGGLLGQSLCRLYTCLQVLLCFFYEALYRTQGGMGHFP